MYEQCQACKSWINMEKQHCTAKVDDKLVYLHDEACLRILKFRVPVTEVKIIPKGG